MLNTIAIKRSESALRKILSLLIIVCVFCLVFILAHRAMFDLDIWLHLKAGEVILKTGAIPSCDIFSFTMQGKPWIDHEWLFQIIVYLIYAVWQADGLVNAQAFILLAAFLVLFFIGQRNLKSYFWASAFMLLALYSSASRFNIRPEIFSLLFFSIYLYILRFNIKKSALWILVPIQILWVNIHGYFFLGPLLVFLFIFAEFLSRRIKLLHWQQVRPLLNNADYERLKKVFFILSLACLVNPRFLEGALYPLYIVKDTLMGHNHIFFKNIQELRPTFNPRSLNLNSNFYSVFLCVLFLLINIRKVKIIDVLLFSVFLVMSFTARNVAFFAFAAYVIITAYFIPAKEKIINFIKPVPLRQGLLPRVIACYILPSIFLFVLISKINNSASRLYYDFDNKVFKSELFGVKANRYPEQAADFIIKNGIKANLLNDFNAGAYLIGRAYPSVKVFIDGRTELYGQDFFKRLSSLSDGDAAIFEDTIKNYKIDGIFFDTSYNFVPPIIAHIYKNPEWKLVFFDGQAVIFLRDLPVYRDIINEHRIDFKNYSSPGVDWHSLVLRDIYPYPYLARATLFYAFQEDEAAISECRDALRIMPACARAYHILGKVFLRKKLYPQARENLHAAHTLLPRNPEIMVDLGTALKYLQETKKALNLFKGAIKRSPDYAEAYYQLAVLYLEDMDNKDAAIKALRKAIKYSSIVNAKYSSKLEEAERSTAKAH